MQTPWTPTAARWLDAHHFITAFRTNHLSVQDIVSKQTFNIGFSAQTTDQVNAILPSSHTVYTAHDDKRIRIFDLRSQKCTKQFVAHTDSVSCIAQQDDRVIVSGGHDGSLRFWDIRRINCVHEISPVHRAKFNEGVLDVKCGQKLLCSVGADGVLKIYQCP